MVMCGIYIADTLEKLTDTVHEIHNKATCNKNCLHVNSLISINGI